MIGDIRRYTQTYADIRECEMIIACRMARSPVTAWGMVVACRMARRRIACRRARRQIASRCVPARVGYLDVPAVFPVGRAEHPSSAMPRPNMAREPTPPPAVYEHVFVYMAVALHCTSFGGAAKAVSYTHLTLPTILRV